MTVLEGEEVFDLTIINADEEELLSSHDGKHFYMSLYGHMRKELNQKCLLHSSYYSSTLILESNNTDKRW